MSVSVLFRQEQGVTLVEIMVVLAIIGLIITGIYSFLFFGHDMFDSGTDKAYLQQKIRNAAEDINREVRTAHLLQLQDQKHEGSVEYSNYIYFDEDKNKIIVSDEERERVLADGIDDLRFNIEKNREILKFTFYIAASDGSEKAYQNTVNLLNRPSVIKDIKDGEEPEEDTVFRSINFSNPG